MIRSFPNGPHVFPLVVALSLGIAGAPQPASAGASLTLAGAITRAKENDLRRAFVDDDSERATWAAHRALTQVFPTLNIGASITQNPQAVEVNNRVVTPLTVPQANARARLSLFRGPDIPNAIAAYMERSAVHHGAKELMESLSHDVAVRFLALAEAGELLDARRKTESRAKRLLKLTRVRVELGEAVPFEIEDARAELARVLAEVALFEGERRASEVRLREVVGDPDDNAPLRITCEACVPPPPGEDGGGALDARQDLAAAEQIVDATFVRETGAWMTLLPSIELIGTGRLQQPTLFNPNLVWWNAQLLMSWEIFSGGRTVVDGFDAHRASRRATLEAKWLRRTAKTDTSTASAALAGASAVLNAARVRTEASASALAQAEASLAEGEVASVIVTEAARNLADAEVAQIRAAYSQLRARLFSRRAKGLPPLDSPSRAAPSESP